ncbi:NADP-binding protein [Dacryopinax primogenitus]|uniref:NADP-binding protein n=1 Tax=Dacryopinax primogenitus (strain DJM 731) TaxID=1858805 RepID=M5G882_DACPD|nr:NADP-binding protein [Dacryopinax primogenitus]EJU06426.1 NADP-binding protein [Dacryopinax primogenitus]
MTSPPATRKIVLCGAGFLASYIARALACNPLNRVQLTGRNPLLLEEKLLGDRDFPSGVLIHTVQADITKPSTLLPAFEGADIVVSLVGLLNATPEQFERVQHQGTRNVALAARDVGAKVVQFSAIGADVRSPVPYWRTKALGEAAVKGILGDGATSIRPSLVFGPGDGFFARFAKLAGVLPFLPVFGGGTTRFQPVFAGDIAQAVEICTRRDIDKEVEKAVAGTTFDAGGPDIFTYKELMQLVLEYDHKSRPIISLPYELGKLQGAVLERLPENLFTITRHQVEQLKYDNVVHSPQEGKMSFEELIKRFSIEGDKDVGNLTSVHAVLPTYLGKRKH